MTENVQMEPTTKVKKPVEKITLVSPYVEHWPNVSKDTEARILETLKQVFESLKLAKQTKVKFDGNVKMTWKEKNARKRKQLKAIWAKSKCHRQHLVLGMSHSLRSLEKDELCAFLVCRNVTPKIMIEPFVSLCSTRAVPGAAISNLGTTLQKLLNFKTCKALGLKRSVAEDETNVFHELLSVIRRHAPKLNSDRLAIERMIEDSKTVNETTIQNREEVTRQPEKDYSYLYIKKVDVKPVRHVETFVPLGDPTPSVHCLGSKTKGNDGDRKTTTAIGRNIRYKTMKIKRIKPANKVKTKRIRKAR